MAILNKKQELFDFYRLESEFKFIDKLILVLKLENNANEVIINSTNIEEKLNYIDKNYNDDLELINNTNIKIINWIIV